MNFETILYEIEDKILTITLNRPDRLNAFTGQMMDELISAFKQAGDDDDVRVIIVTGSGRGFCAGADLGAGEASFNRDENPRSPKTEDKENLEWIRDGGGRTTLAIFDCPKPVIAAINGPAVGVGVTMTLPMDIRIASDKARFGFVFSRRGAVPEACSSWFLPRIVGISKALDWCFSGKVFSAQEALKHSLVSEVIEEDNLIKRALEIGNTYISKTSSVSVSLSRQMLWRMLGANHPQEAHLVDSLAMEKMGKSSDIKEGILSFLEKREPKFPMKVSKDLPDIGLEKK